MIIHRKYIRFSDLPNHIRTRILESRVVSEDEVQAWVKHPIPALAQKSVLEVMNSDDGEQAIIGYLVQLPK
jgi:hypothetical protein